MSVSSDGRVVVGRANNDSGDHRAFRHNEGDAGITDLGTLKIDNSGFSEALSVSSDGRVVVGRAETDSGYYRAFRHNEGDNRVTDLGTLKSDNSEGSAAKSISADGRVVIGTSVADSANSHAFRHNAGDARMTDLGTLKSDNSGGSDANSVSANGRVVVGKAASDSGNDHAYRHNEGDARMTDLGTLKHDNSGASAALAVSSDGRVVVGGALTDDNTFRAFRHNEDDARMTDLGTLSRDNSRASAATGVSSDGRVVIGGAETDDGSLHAFRHNAGDARMTDLGTLQHDNLGLSMALSVSADGRFVVGQAQADATNLHAFHHKEGNTKLTDLGTLKDDNSGTSVAYSVSADGSVVVGMADTNNGHQHATVWKVKYQLLPDPETPEAPTTPETPEKPVVPEKPTTPEVVIVDKDNSHQAMMDTANRGHKVLDLYQSALDSLSNSRCQLGTNNYCVGVFSQFDRVSSNHRVATGLFGALRLPYDNWTVGGAINYANNTQLMDNYDTRGKSSPGLAIYTRYQANTDNSGLGIELSGAFLNQDIKIKRDQWANTEAGEGDSRIKGSLVSLGASYGINLNHQTQISPFIALSHHKVVRDGYTETRNAEFAATYGRMGNKRTELQLGLTTKHTLNQATQIDGGVGANIKLRQKRDAFTGQIDYIGAYVYDRGKSKNVRPYAYIGMNLTVTPRSTIRTNLAWQKTDYRNNAVQLGLTYSYHW